MRQKEDEQITTLYDIMMIGEGYCQDVKPSICTWDKIIISPLVPAMRISKE